MKSEQSRKHIVITGGAGAVGLACAAYFLDRGARIFLTDRIAPDAAHLPTTASTENLFFHAADVADPAEVARAFEAALTFGSGRIDAAVLTAGIEGPVGPLEEVRPEDVDAVLDVNVKGALFWLQQCLRTMKAQGAGSVVALSSISGLVGSPLLGCYAISKHAVMGMVKTAALEAGPHGVRINAVCPGPIDSAMMRRLDKALLDLNPSRFAGQTDSARSLPLQRYASTAEVAAMVGFLCSDEAGYCNGGSFTVDGGFTAK